MGQSHSFVAVAFDSQPQLPQLECKRLSFLSERDSIESKALRRFALLLMAYGNMELRVLSAILRVAYYIALANMLFGIVALFLPFAREHCTNASCGIVKCTSPTHWWFFETGFTIVMMGVFAGLPTPLGLGGLAFLFSTFAIGANAESVLEKHNRAGVLGLQADLA